MVDENDFAKAKAVLKADMAVLDADVAKVKAFWSDYRLYIVCTLCLIVGGFLGSQLHRL